LSANASPFAKTATYAHQVCAVWLITFGGILVLGVAQGMIVGVGSSLLIMLKTESRPTHAVLGRLRRGSWRVAGGKI
jgi:MFS superfamily sulfate permease-like transporter